MFKKIIFSAVIILALVAGAFGSTIFHNLWGSGETAKVSSALIASKVSEISEYASLEVYYTDAAKFEDPKNFYGWKVPLTTKSFIYTYDGAMKMGVEGKDIAVEKKGKQIVVSMPPAKILSHEIKEDTVKALYETQNVFNPIRLEDYSRFAADQKRKMETKALEEGLLEEAGKRAEGQIELFIKGFVGDDGEYEIVFQNKSAS